MSSSESESECINLADYMCKPVDPDVEQYYDIDGESVETTLSFNPDVIGPYFGDIMSSLNKSRVVGLDTELGLTETLNAKCRTATLQICHDSHCLVISISQMQSIPQWECVLNFLRNSHVTFVGVGIRESLARLKEEYGIGCKNAVELGDMAADILNKPYLRYCGIEEIAMQANCSFKELRIRYSSYKQDDRDAMTFTSWGNCKFSTMQLRYAAINTYAYCKIAKQLLKIGSEENGTEMCDD